MLAFRMSIAAAGEFYRRAGLLVEDTLENRNKILLQMVEEGLINGVTETNKSPQEYLDHLKKNFDVVDLTGTKAPEEFDPEKTLDAVWCQDSTTGERVLIDRKTNKIIMREGEQ